MVTKWVWSLLLVLLLVPVGLFISKGSPLVLDGELSKISAQTSPPLQRDPIPSEEILSDEDDDGEDRNNDQQGESLSPERIKHLKDPDARADDVLNQLLKKLGKEGPFPIIVGGIGDSGTRGVREVLKAFRVQMLGDHYVNRQGDSEIFERSFPVYDAKTKLWSERTARMLYKQGIHRARTLQYNETHFNAKTWEFGRQFVGAMLWRTLNISAALRGERGYPFKFWGMKHPRSMLILPFLASAMGNNMKYIHVLRDPKEVASGDNQQMFVGECRRYYGREKCSRSYEKKYEFWTDLDMDAYAIAKRYLTKDSYMIVRIEDLVLGEAECYERLAKFVGIPDKSYLFDLARAQNSTASHVSSYMGHGYGLVEDIKAQLFAALKHTPARVRKFMEAVGYSTTAFRLTKSCMELPSL